MTKFNIFDILLFASHSFAFSFSPIDGDRYKLEYEQRRSAQCQESEAMTLVEQYQNKLGKYRWPGLYDLLRLIKRQHLSGSWFISYFVIHMLAQFHMTVKMVFHALITRNDSTEMEYYDSIYYPHPMTGLTSFYMFNNLMVAMCLKAFCLRLSAAFSLIKNSLINQNEYTIVYPNQINIAYGKIFNLKRTDWHKLLTHLVTYWKNSKKANSSSKASTNVPRVIHESIKDSIILENPLNSNEFFDKLGIDFGDPPRRYAKWHVPEPNQRLSPKVLLICIFGAVSVSFIIIFTTTSAFFAFIYMHMTSRSPNAIPSLGEVIPKSLRPLMLIKQFEFALFLIMLIPEYIDTTLFALDMIVLISKIYKLTSIYQCVSTSMLMLVAGEGRVTQEHPLNDPIKRYCPAKISYYLLTREHVISSKLNYSSSTSCELAKKIENLTKLMKALHGELELVKRSHHASLVNILLIGNSICIAYSLSIFSAMTDEPGMVTLMVLCYVSYTIPVISLLICCTYLELTVRLDLRCFTGSYNLSLPNYVVHTETVQAFIQSPSPTHGFSNGNLRSRND